MFECIAYFLRARHSCKHVRCISFRFSQQLREVAPVTTPLLQLSKLRLWATALPQAAQLMEETGQDLNPRRKKPFGRLAYESGLSPAGRRLTHTPGTERLPRPGGSEMPRLRVQRDAAGTQAVTTVCHPSVFSPLFSGKPSPAGSSS